MYGSKGLSRTAGYFFWSSPYKKDYSTRGICWGPLSMETTIVAIARDCDGDCCGYSLPLCTRTSFGVRIPALLR